MAALFLVRTDDPAFAQQALATAGREGAPADGIAPTGFAFPGWRGLHWPMAHGGPDALLTRGDDLVAVAGTISVDGLMGRPALERLLDMPGLPRPDWTRIAGQFVALVRRGGRAWLFTDWFAAFQLFHDTGHRLFSTSLLAAAHALPRLSFDAQGLYEWAFNAAALGDDTVFAELKTLGPRVAIELGEGGTTLHPLAKDLPEQATHEPLPDRLERHRAALAAVVAPAVAQFGDRVICPLSGGLDSRLAVAALHAAGSRPHLYVYGPQGSPDVEVALAIARAQGFPVEWRDKRAAPLAADAFPEQVARNFRDGDGLPNYGNIFDNGGNSAAQAARHAGGALAVSGGCGEIYRDFFYLPNRPMRASAIAETFFARFVRSDATELFEPRAFLARIAGKIADAVGLPDDGRPIPRAIVEQVYPRVRCRALFGREISLEARLGAYLMPFLDHRVVAEAMTLPIALKPAGRFEAALLHAIDPALAAQPSAYGHHFAGPPSRRHRWEEWNSRIRPTWLRRHSYAIRRRLGPVGDEHGGLLTPDYMGRVIDLEMPAMRRYFHVDRITDSGLWRRVACLEYLAGRLGGRLTTSAS